MKRFLNRSCKIHIKMANNSLFFNVKRVTSIDDSIICFIDREDKEYCFNKCFIMEITEI